MVRGEFGTPPAATVIVAVSVVPAEYVPLVTDTPIDPDPLPAPVESWSQGALADAVQDAEPSVKDTVTVCVPVRGWFVPAITPKVSDGRFSAIRVSGPGPGVGVGVGVGVGAGIVVETSADSPLVMAVVL
jgi:hypothetical protein